MRKIEDKIKRTDVDGKKYSLQSNQQHSLPLSVFLCRETIVVVRAIDAIDRHNVTSITIHAMMKTINICRLEKPRILTGFAFCCFGVDFTVLESCIGLL